MPKGAEACRGTDCLQAAYVFGSVLTSDAPGELERYRREVSRERILTEVDAQNMVLFALYRAVKYAIDLGQHVIAERGLPVPAAYREVFRVLAEAGVVEPELASRLEGWGGMGNVIAHQYGSLDYARVADALHDEVGDLHAFAATMAALGT